MLVFNSIEFLEFEKRIPKTCVSEFFIWEDIVLLQIRSYNLNCSSDKYSLTLEGVIEISVGLIAS